MCGIVGIIAFNDKGKELLKRIDVATQLLHHRGPDYKNHKTINDNAAFGHARLSIIDTSAASNQPFSDHTENYTIVYNGEIFNYKELRSELIKEGYNFRTEGDVEVLLNLYIHKKEKCLHNLKGFFSFAIYDKQKNSVFIARDRFGVKPLYYYQSKDAFCFSSELRTVQYITDSKKLNKSSLYTYLQLNYLPGEESILTDIKRLEPGHHINCSALNFIVENYYKLKINVKKPTENVGQKLKLLLTEAVESRMVSDVPVGSFLSGGIDSSIITGIASQFSPHINTFSIGFKDNPYFDETQYAELVAKKFKTNHHSFILSNDDLLNEFDNFLAAIDEPFADSSALNVYILSKHTKKYVKVALSGDGADEIFAGYNKHRAEWMIRNKKTVNALAPAISGLSSLLPKSRNSALLNKFRQVKRYNDGLKLSIKERYWLWASISSEEEIKKLLAISDTDLKHSSELKNKILSELSTDYNSILKTDLELVLPYDMLTKVDMMSMANGLEVRNPFMDNRLIEYAFTLDESYKINKSEQKIILKNVFAYLLPEEILKRKKHGFEVPLLKWFNNELKSKIENDWLNEDFIHAQGIFNYTGISNLKKELYSNSPGDSAAKVWALIIFNEWWKRHIQN